MIFFFFVTNDIIYNKEGVWTVDLASQLISNNVIRLARIEPKTSHLQVNII